jgi:hypothetical protein
MRRVHILGNPIITIFTLQPNCTVGRTPRAISRQSFLFLKGRFINQSPSLPFFRGAGKHHNIERTWNKATNIMNLIAASFLFASISISFCSALDFTVVDTVDIDTNGNLPPLLAERDEEAVPSIVGGDAAADGAYPWFGRSRITYSKSGTIVSSFTCGASLIHPRVAVSAMHCAKGILAPTFHDIKVTLFFGANLYDGTDAVAVRNVQELRYPTMYNFPFNDIVLYTWDEPVNNIKPIAFNRVEDLPSAGSMGRAIGFGLTTHQGSASSILLQVDLNVVAVSVCNDNFSGSPDHSESELVCVQPPEGLGICQGDSGGPLFTIVGGTLTLLGIASFVGKCGASPSGFTATSHFQQFIDNVSENVGTCFVLVLTMCGLPAAQNINMSTVRLRRNRWRIL